MICKQITTAIWRSQHLNVLHWSNIDLVADKYKLNFSLLFSHSWLDSKCFNLDQITQNVLFDGVLCFHVRLHVGDVDATWYRVYVQCCKVEKLFDLQWTLDTSVILPGLLTKRCKRAKVQDGSGCTVWWDCPQIRNRTFCSKHASHNKSGREKMFVLKETCQKEYSSHFFNEDSQKVENWVRRCVASLARHLDTVSSAVPQWEYWK